MVEVFIIIITFKENSTYITHRIIQIQDNFFITKGDNNNVSDANLVSYENIQGKVVFSIPSFDKIINYFNSPLGFVLIFVFILLLFFSDLLSLIKNKSISLKSISTKFVLVLAFLFFIAVITMSKFTDDTSASDNARSASFIIDGNEVTQNISFSDWVPGSSKNYNIIIKNFNDSFTADTAQKYSFILKKQNNLPLVYYLTPINNDATYGSMIQGQVITFNNDNVGILSGGIIPPNDAVSHEYKLSIVWDSDNNNYILSSKQEDISITIESVQLDSLN